MDDLTVWAYDHVALERALLRVSLRRSWASGESVWVAKDRFIKQEYGTIKLYCLTPRYLYHESLPLGAYPLAAAYAYRNGWHGVGWQVCAPYQDRARRVVAGVLTREGAGL